MATYIIGDLQGCYDELMTLLKQINYHPKHDELWFAGDIVNRGPKSLECLEFVKSLGSKGKMVLGNHDFHLLSAYSGKAKTKTLEPILNAPNADELINWLRHQPLIIQHPNLPVVMVHAGIPPQWNIKEALTYAQEVEHILQSHHWKEALTEHLYGDQPSQWNEHLKDWDRSRYIINAFVRMRFCSKTGELEFKTKTMPNAQNNPLFQPWFSHPNRKNKDQEIFFGHWSTLGAMDAYQVHSTDTGCLWGGKLTAYCLETQQRHTLNCQANCNPHKH